jgi:hypothetical protein
MRSGCNTDEKLKSTGERLLFPCPKSFSNLLGIVVSACVAFRDAEKVLRVGHAKRKTDTSNRKLYRYCTNEELEPTITSTGPYNGHTF